MPIYKERKHQEQRRNTSNLHQMQSKQSSKETAPNYEALIPPPLQLSSESPYKTLEDQFRPPEERGKPLQKREMPLQRYKIDETKWGHTEPKQSMLSGSMDAIFQRVLSREAPTKKQTQNPETSSNAPLQKKENKTGLPDNLKSGIENLSGYSMDDVKVHYNSSKPTQLQAHAYAQGSDIHIASGQEKHLPHEAWHVVQQKQGRVKPTMQMKGVRVNDDVGLEREADRMGSSATKYIQQDENKRTIQTKSNSFPTIQRMKDLPTDAKKYSQTGGTCGLHSLYMALYSFDSSIDYAAIAQEALTVTTLVGDIMNIEDLKTICSNVGYDCEVIDFNVGITGTPGTLPTLAESLKNTKLDGAVVIAYSNAKLNNKPLDTAKAQEYWMSAHYSVLTGFGQDLITLHEDDETVNLVDPNYPKDKTIEIDDLVEANKAMISSGKDKQGVDGKFDMGKFADASNPDTESSLKGKFQDFLDGNFAPKDEKWEKIAEREHNTDNTNFFYHKTQTPLEYFRSLKSLTSPDWKKIDFAEYGKDTTTYKYAKKGPTFYKRKKENLFSSVDKTSPEIPFGTNAAAYKPTMNLVGKYLLIKGKKTI